MKKVLVTVVIVTALAIVFLFGCKNSSKVAENKKIKIGITVYDQYDTYVSELVKCFEDIAKDELDIVIYNASQSQQTQNTQVQKMIDDGCSVICVNLVDRTDPSAVIDKARKNNVPIIFFNRELVSGDIGRWNKLFYVGADAVQSGTMQGEMAAMSCITDKSIDKNGDGMIQFVMLEGEAGHQDSIVRSENSVNALIEAGIVLDRVGYAIANWNRAQAQTKMAQFLENYPGEIELVLANNDDMALGAIDAYDAAEIIGSDRPIILGVDGTDEGLKAVRDDKMIGTVYNDKEGQARAMFRLAKVLALGGDISELSEEFTVEDGKYIRLPYAKVTAGNVNKFMKK